MHAIRTLDKAAERGAIHPNNASRRKSRLMRHLAVVNAQPALAIMEPASSSVVMSEAEVESEGTPKKKGSAKKGSPAKKQAAKKPVVKKAAKK